MKKSTKFITIMLLSLFLFGCEKEKQKEQGPLVNPNAGNVTTEKDKEDVQDVESVDIYTVDEKDKESATHEKSGTSTVVKHGKTGKTKAPLTPEQKEEKKILEEVFGPLPEEEHDYFEDIKVGDKTFKDVYLGDDGKFHSSLEGEKEFRDLQIVVRYYDEDGNQIDYKIMFLDYNESIKEDPNFSFELDGVDPDKVASISIEPFGGAGSKYK